MIKESETCAVFGLAMPCCLEHHELKTCRNRAPLAICCATEDIIFNTTLILTTTEFLAAPLPCALGERPILWDREDVLEVTRAALPLQSVNLRSGTLGMVH
jgi:hypothetical protein